MELYLHSPYIFISRLQLEITYLTLFFLLFLELTCTSKLHTVITGNVCSQGYSPHKNAVWNIGDGGCIWFVLLCNKCEEICYKVQEGPPSLQHLHGVGWRIFHCVHARISSGVPPWYFVTNCGYVATLLYLLDQIQLLSCQILTNSTTGIVPYVFLLDISDGTRKQHYG